MAPGGEMFRNPLHFGENVLPYGSHEWLPYSVIPTLSKQICKHQFSGLPRSADCFFHPRRGFHNCQLSIVNCQFAILSLHSINFSRKEEPL